MDGTKKYLEIELTQNKKAILDIEDYEKISKYKWYAHTNGTKYCAVTNVRVGGKRKQLLMHRVILGLQQDDNVAVRHINGNKLDNRRENLQTIK